MVWSISNQDPQERLKIYLQVPMEKYLIQVHILLRVVFVDGKSIGIICVPQIIALDITNNDNDIL